MNVAPSTVQLPSASSPSPLQIELRFRLNVPPEEAFELVTTRLGEWFTAIHAVTWNHANSNGGVGNIGACSERVCDFGGKALVENIVEFEPGRRYAYSADMARSPNSPERHARGIASFARSLRLSCRNHAYATRGLHGRRVRARRNAGGGGAAANSCGQPHSPQKGSPAVVGWPHSGQNGITESK